MEQGKDCDLEILTCLLSVQHSLEQSLPAADLKVMLDSVGIREGFNKKRFTSGQPE